MNIPHEQYVHIYNGLPRPIRDFLIDEEFNTIIQDVGHKYQLHVDTMGVLSEIVTQMLLGLLNPVLALDNMKNSGVPLDTARLIITDLNQKVFIPLRNRVREQHAEESALKETASASAVPVMHVEVPMQTASIPEPATPLSSAFQVSTAPVVAAPMRTMAHDMEAAKSGKIPSYSVPNAPVPANLPIGNGAGPWQTTPARSFLTSSVPSTAPSPIVPAPVQAVPVALPTSPVPAFSMPETVKSAQEVPLSKQFGADPYREPV